MTPGTPGLYYNRNRWYNLQLGRFASRDPNETAMPIVGAMLMNAASASTLLSAFSPMGHFGDGMNLYTYLDSNPLRSTDPSGLFSIADPLTGTSSGAAMWASTAQTASGVIGYVQGVAGAAAAYNFAVGITATAAYYATVSNTIDPALWSEIAFELGRFTHFMSSQGNNFINGFNNWLNGTGGTGMPGGPD